MTDTPPQTTITLKHLCDELKVDPREARMALRLAAKRRAEFPTLGKDRAARQPWEWAAGSKALTEARKALTAALSSQ
jgi:hypothetical protein